MPPGHQQPEQGMNLTTTSQSSSSHEKTPNHDPRKEITRQETNRHMEMQLQMQKDREKLLAQQEEQQERLRQQAILREASKSVENEKRTALVSGHPRASVLGHAATQADGKPLSIEAIQAQHGIQVGMMHSPDLIRRAPGSISAFNPPVSGSDLTHMYNPELQHLGMLRMMNEAHLYPQHAPYLPSHLATLFPHGIPADGRFPGAPGRPGQTLLSPGGPLSHSASGKHGSSDSIPGRIMQDSAPGGEGSLLSLLEVQFLTYILILSPLHTS